MSGAPEHSLERGRKTSIINFKGGVGKTTLALHLATYLATDHKVLLVDVDHQSSLSIVILGSALWEKQVKAQKTVNRVFESFCNRKIPMPKGEIIVPNPIGAREVSYVLAQREMEKRRSPLV